MSFSGVLFGVGFLIAWLGAIMVYLSLRKEKIETEHAKFGFLNRTLHRINESRKLIRFVIAIGFIITGIIFAATIVGIIKW
jgi:ABC-type transport system involved in cytochrome c biogenesis permease subunit